jgi:hypothetical protein
MSKQVEFTFEQLVEWGEKSPGLKLGNHTPEAYIKLMEDFPPPEVFNNVRPSIIEEGVSANDITITIVNEQTGDRYNFNPGLDLVFNS